ncbi:hypothetical protein LAZ67_18000221 [Cordylochernes scorpioides]|uniref:Uncharacterized protein n=1 Tax=Cordylochernes scorpioides TaxID=51811 RepID=A0ABY6LER6_9ARAC|nr:hypothetical protein LAZ67_18000221 [Cordylochernes scorpioides]
MFCIDIGKDDNIFAYCYDASQSLMFAYKVSKRTMWILCGYSLVRYETTNSLLQFTLHLLIHHPDVQDKVRAEVREVQGNKVSDHGTVVTLAPLGGVWQDVFDPQDASNLHYTEQVLMEVMRLYPPSPVGVQRKANEDYLLDDSKLIPRSIPILAPLDALHRDTKYWANPETFDPDRFSPEKRYDFPYLSHQPFGAGPRTCIGRRVALTVAKTFLALLLTKYRLVKCHLTDKVTIFDFTASLSFFLSRCRIFQAESF